MRSTLPALLSLCVCCMFQQVAHGATLTFTETVNANGSLNNTAFTNQLVTLNLVVDPSTVTGSNGGIFITPLLTLTGTVANYGSFSISGCRHSQTK